MNNALALTVYRGSLAEAYRKGWDSLAEDLAQEVVLKVLVRPKEAKRPVAFTVIDAVRKLLGRSTKYETVALGDSLMKEPDMTPCQLIDLPLHVLTERERVVFLLAGLYGLELSEIAQVIGMSRHVVGDSYRRAKSKLEEALK
jgi:DNA-directed RNA polymerase specialized sigma24 family protein